MNDDTLGCAFGCLFLLVGLALDALLLVGGIALAVWVLRALGVAL